MFMLICGATLGALLSSLVEYCAHRLLHLGRLRDFRLYKIHLEHHRSGRNQPWWRESLDYGLVALAFSPGAFLFLDGYWAAGWLAATFGWAVAAGVAHARSHERLDSAHLLHHHYPRSNYGVVTHAWDRVFRTYRKP